MTSILASACLALFCVLGVFDGVYFHLIRFRLHERPESRTEHLIHTVRAFVFVPIALVFFAYDTRGPALIAGMAIIALDLGLEVIDILIERESRALIGGISCSESAIHVFASSFRMAALAFVLGSKPLADFRLGGMSVFTATSPELHLLGTAFAACALAGGFFSVMAMARASPSGYAPQNLRAM